MSAPALVTVEAYGILDLPPAIRDRVIERERVDAWDTWLTDEVGHQLADLIRDRLDGVEDVEVTAWAMLHGGAPSMVVEGRIVDADAFAIAVGVPGHDVGEGLDLAPYHGRGGQWAGTTDVLRHDADEGCERDDVMSEALGEVIGEVLAAVASWAESAESDESLAEGLDAGGWRFDRLGRHLDAVIVDAPEGVVA
jgi:hypothetical protein